MGNQNSLGTKQISELKKETGDRLTKADIKRYHKFWHDLYPSGEMSKDGFKKFADIAMPNKQEDADVDYLFRAMDKNGDGKITFKEFLMFQSITAPTTKPLEVKELIELAFTMYDEDNDGYVTAEEMRDSLTNMFKAKGLNTDSPEIKKVIDQRIKNLLELADENGDNMLTAEEIMKACEKDPSLLVMF